MNNTCVCVVCYVILHANTCITLLLPLHQTEPFHDDDADTNIGLYLLSSSLSDYGPVHDDDADRPPHPRRDGF